MAPKAKRVKEEPPAITPAKRRANGKTAELTPSTPSTVPSPGDLALPPRELLDDPDKPWVVQVLSILADIHTKGAPLNEWLEKKIATMGPDAWVSMVDNAFPPLPGVTYMREADMKSPGSKSLRLWQLGIHPDTGNAGLMVNEETDALVQLMCVYGFRTDANVHQGAEKLAGRCADMTFEEAYSQIFPFAPKKSLAPVFSCWHIKGWKRSVCAVAIATIIAEADLATAMQEKWPETFASFCCVHSVFEKGDTDGVESIWAARSITMASTSTRRAPNAFNHLHQIRKLEKLGHKAASEMDSWAARKGVMKAFQIGEGEAKAALNLASLPLSFVSRLQKMVQINGFRLCMTHTALAMDIIRLGCGPVMANKKWQEDLKNDEYTIELLGKRIELDWEASRVSRVAFLQIGYLIAFLQMRLMCFLPVLTSCGPGHAEVAEEAFEPADHGRQAVGLRCVQQDPPHAAADAPGHCLPR